MTIAESEPLYFPVNLDPDDPYRDILITQADAEQVRPYLRFDHIAAISAALRAKRDYVLKQTAQSDFDSDGDDDLSDSPTILANHPNVSLFIDAEDLAQYERPISGRWSLVMAMQDTCASTGFERALGVASISPKIATFNTRIIKIKTNGRYSLGFRNLHLMIIDNKKGNGSLKVGNKEFAGVLIPHGNKRQSFGGFNGFTNDQLVQIAAGELAGVQPSEIGLEDNQKSLKVRRANTNRLFAGCGFPLLAVIYGAGRLYCLDLEQTEHRKVCHKIRANIAINAPRGSPPSTKAEILAMRLFPEAARKTTNLTLPVRGVKSLEPIAAKIGNG